MVVEMCRFYTTSGHPYFHSAIVSVYAVQTTNLVKFCRMENLLYLYKIGFVQQICPTV